MYKMYASISHTLVSLRFGRDLFSPINFQVEDEMSPVRERYGEAFWRAHYECLDRKRTQST
jgi:hypothetical protein